jgi:predicted RNA polymerase sigma factor
MIDHVRSEAARRGREADAAVDLERPVTAPDDEAGDQDDTLVLIFMCCHPTLTTSSAIALTLRAIGGLTTAEIARAFLVPEGTMAQRISRAKQTIRSSGAAFRMPAGAERADRLAAVLHVLYLIFNEGYASSSGADVHRQDLAAEAIRLTRAIHALLPDDPEVTGLLALMLLTDARRLARTGADGELIPLAEQDRSKWDHALIAEGVALVTSALSRAAVGPYQLQAAVAALHDEAARVEDTDWPQIRALYGLLMQMSDNPMVRLNHAIATAMVQGLAAGLTELSALEDDERLRGHHRLAAVRAHLLEMEGQVEAAVEQYRTAAERTTSVPERNYLITRAARLR